MRLVLAFAVALTVLFSATASADARTGPKSFAGPVRIDGVSQFPIYRDLGVRIFQTTLFWNDIAAVRPRNARNPRDPAYTWPAHIDDAVSEAKKSGMRISIQVIGAPKWANGDRPWNWAPRKPSDYANFMAAAAGRYPSVHMWMVWGEPSRGPNFQPLTPALPGRRLSKKQAAAPRLYARILDAAYGTLKRRSKRNLVVGGNTYTTGDISTAQWIKYMRLPNKKPPRMDLYGHNPFSFRRPNLNNPPSPQGQVDFSDLKRLTKVIDKNLRKSNKRKLRLFLSEWTIPTANDQEFNFHVVPALQAEWISAALAITRRWSRIYALGWIHLRDNPPATFGGLLDENGAPKPGYAAFRDG